MTTPVSQQASGGGTATASVPVDTHGANLEAATALLLREAREALDRGQASDAERALERVSAAAASHPEYLRLLGITRQLQKRPHEAVAALRAALEEAPGDALILTNLGSALRAAGEPQAAMVALVRACELAPTLAPAWYNLGRAHGAEARAEEARGAFEQALACDPAYVRARLAHADALRTLGRTAEAVSQYRLLLAEHGLLEAWSRLASIKTVKFDASECARLERLFAAPDLPSVQRTMIGFALAKALEDGARYSEAFAVLGMVNAGKRRETEWSADAFSASIDAILRAFPAPLATAASATLGHEAIFIVSLPRSGSTLTEQILASHPDVEGANELPDLGAVLDEESGRTGIEFPGWVAQATPADWRRLGERYLERTARWRRAKPRFTDKALSNWRYIGAAAAMLPGAIFVDCRRDPVETCLSCYRQLFVRGQAFSYDIADLARYWHDYARMMRFWQSRYPGSIHSQVHEKLIADPETEVRQLLDACCLSFDAACLRPHRTQRQIRTLSSAQVREPLRADTARAWRYGDLLAPLQRALQGP